MTIKKFVYEKRNFLVIRTRYVECTACIAFKEKTCKRGAIFNKYCDKSKTKGWKKIILKETLKETRKASGRKLCCFWMVFRYDGSLQDKVFL